MNPINTLALAITLAPAALGGCGPSVANDAGSGGGGDHTLDTLEMGGGERCVVATQTEVPLNEAPPELADAVASLAGLEGERTYPATWFDGVEDEVTLSAWYEADALQYVTFDEDTRVPPTIGVDEQCPDQWSMVVHVELATRSGRIDVSVTELYEPGHDDWHFWRLPGGDLAQLAAALEMDPEREDSGTISGAIRWSPDEKYGVLHRWYGVVGADVEPDVLLAVGDAAAP